MGLIEIVAVSAVALVFINLALFMDLKRIHEEQKETRRILVRIKTQLNKQENLKPRPSYIPVLTTIINEVLEVKTEIKELKNRGNSLFRNKQKTSQESDSSNIINEVLEVKTEIKELKKKVRFCRQHIPHRDYYYFIWLNDSGIGYDYVIFLKGEQVWRGFGYETEESAKFAAKEWIREVNEG
jgi:hypothetical protein